MTAQPELAGMPVPYVKVSRTIKLDKRAALVDPADLPAIGDVFTIPATRVRVAKRIETDVGWELVMVEDDDDQVGL